MSNTHHPRWRPPMANGRAAGTRTARPAPSVPHTAETASVDLAKPMRLRVTPGAVIFLVIGLLGPVGALAPDEVWWQRVIFAMVGIASFWFGWYGFSIAWCRRNLVLDSAGVRVQLKRRCKFDFPWEDLAFVEVARRPGGYSMSRPGMVWLDFYPGPDFVARHPKQARLCKRHPTGQAYRYQLGPIRKTIPALDKAFRSVRPEQYRGIREQSWSETPMFTWRR
jgi:hypothetical protein